MFFGNRHRLGGAARRRAASALIGLISFLAAAASTAAAEQACTTERFPALARGFNLTGWFDEAKPRPPSRNTLAELRRLGMRHVRLTIAGDSIIADFASAGAVAAKVAAIDAAIDLLIRLDYSVIVDLHGGDRLFALLRSDPVQGQARIGEAWRALAPLFKPGRSGRLYAELLNEPPLEGADWARMQAALLPMLRGLLPTTPLILSTGGPQRVEALTASEPIADRNVLYAIHFYDPFYFTHQGADWIDDVPGIGALRDMPFPVVPGSERLNLTIAELRLDEQTTLADKLAGLKEPYGEAEIAGAMQSLADWSARTAAPVIIDEFGVYSGRALKAERIHWLEAVTGAAQARCLGWTHWEFRDGFGFVDAASGRPDPELTRALLGRTP